MIAPPTNRSWCTRERCAQELEAGTAVAIVAAYKQVMLHDALLVDKWIGQVFWYCVDGATVMPSTRNGVCSLLQKL